MKNKIKQYSYACQYFKSVNRSYVAVLKPKANGNFIVLDDYFCEGNYNFLNKI